MRVLDATDPAAPRPSLEDLSGVVMFGGTMNVDEVDEHPFLKENRDLTREAIDRGVPYLGICLGAQMLARALDAPRLARRREGGRVRARAAAAGRGRGPAAVRLGRRRHGLPVAPGHDGASPRAPSRSLTGDRIPVQAYRVGELAWATQFHFEIDAAELEIWLDDASQFMDLKEVWGKSPAEIRAEAARTHGRPRGQGVGDVRAVRRDRGGARPVRPAR